MNNQYEHIKYLNCLLDNKVKDIKTTEVPISLIVLCFNQESLIVQSISSVINQLCEGDEIIIIDDSSSDQSAHIARNYLQDNQVNFRVRLFTKDINKGLNHSLNIIPEIANQQNIITLAGDDFYYPGAIKQLKELINLNPNYSALYSSCNIIDMNGNLIGCSDYSDNFYPYSVEWLSEIGGSNLQGHSIAGWNSKILKSFGPLSSKISNEDDQIILRSSLLGNICVSPKRLKAYRKSNGSMSSPMVNFKQPAHKYLEGIVTPLKNRLANYRASIELISNPYNLNYLRDYNVEQLVSNFNNCINCLSTTINLIENKNFIKRVRILFLYLIKNGRCKCIYYNHNFIIALSHRMYFFFKKRRYYNIYSA